MRVKMMAVVAVVAALGVRGAAEQADAAIRVDAGNVVNRITPLMYGSGMEDVNHEVYGGIYAQMIFGESFEEPPQVTPASGWTPYGGHWQMHAGVCTVEPGPGPKLVREAPELRDGTVRCDVRLRDHLGENAGLILRVQNPRTGADTFTGYEISINAKRRLITLGRHRDDWQLLREVPAPVEPGRWHRLRVQLSGPTIRVFLDEGEKPAIEYQDPAPVLFGRVGLRAWHAGAAFRDLVVETPSGVVQESFGTPTSPSGTISGMWEPVRTGAAEPRFQWDGDHAFNTTRSQRIELTRGDGTAGVANLGLNRWGLTFRQGRSYAGTLYLRGDRFPGRVTVALQSADGSRTYATQRLGTVRTEWRHYSFKLRPDQTDTNARFALWIDRPGAVWVDQVYLSGTGKELFRGLPVRGDIGRMLQAQGLTMLRYGGLMVNVPGYRWKQMIGERDRRPQHAGYWYQQSTNGFGIDEFVRFCRAAGFEPVVTISIEERPEDAADLVEYLNGPITTRWGRRRAENGHPKPYNVRYIQIGNEEAIGGNPAEYAHYLERFKLLYGPMRRHDPDLQLIIAAWWRPEEPLVRRIVQELNGKAALWDVHVWSDNLREGDEVDRLFTQMRRLFQEWAPGTSMKACVLEENGNMHNLHRALGHAHVLNAVERHGDFVVMDSPANALQPWQQNDNGWDQGQVFFTSGQVWGMPPFYAQQMAAANYLPLRVGSEVTSPNNELDVTATRSEDGSTLVLKVVNIGGQARRGTVELERFGSVASRAEVWTLSGRLEERNTPEHPERVRWHRTTFEGAARTFDYEFPAHSYTILRLRGR